MAFLLAADLRGTVVTQISDDSAAEADGPTVISVGEEDSFQRMLGAAAFGGPMFAAVGRVNYCSLGAHRPALASVQKLYVKQIDITRRLLPLPRSTTIDSLVDITPTTDGPSFTIVDK